MPGSAKPHPAIRDFTLEQWDEMSIKLMGFTYQYFQGYFRGDISKSQTFDGSTFADIAQEIVLRVLNGSRQWNPEKHGDLLPYMAGQVKSLVNHEMNSWNAKNIDSKKEEDESSSEMVPVFAQPASSPNPELVLISKEMSVEREELLEIILEAVQQSDDDELWSLTEFYLDESGDYEPRHLASRLGVTPAEVQNRQKRLIRSAQRYLMEHPLAQTGRKGDQDEK